METTRPAIMTRDPSKTCLKAGRLTAIPIEPVLRCVTGGGLNAQSLARVTPQTVRAEYSKGDTQNSPCSRTKIEEKAAHHAHHIPHTHAAHIAYQSNRFVRLVEPRGQSQNSYGARLVHITHTHHTHDPHTSHTSNERNTQRATHTTQHKLKLTRIWVWGVGRLK